MLTPPSDIREVSGLSDDQRNAIRHFMQGAVYCWVKNRKSERFAVRDLMGGQNTRWHGTPLMVLYENHKARGKDDAAAIEAAGQDLGWLVKRFLSEDKRTFEFDNAGFVNTYRWVGDEP
jgi:hypothetical protein